MRTRAVVVGVSVAAVLVAFAFFGGLVQGPLHLAGAQRAWAQLTGSGISSGSAAGNWVVSSGVPAVPQSAAAALRRGDCDAALAPLAAAAERRGEGPPVASSARLLYGLYAHACERLEIAERELQMAVDPGGALEDWRLMVLADSALALDHPGLASTALAALVADHPASPLALRALLRGAEAAWAAGERDAAWRWIEEGRKRSDDASAATSSAEFDALAWRLAMESEDLARQLTAARRLLAQAPARAAELEVIELFRASEGGDRPGGTLDWAMILTSEELVLRAERLLAAGLAASAETTLTAVAPPQRDLRWRLLVARSRTAQFRGGDALAVLADVVDGTLAGPDRARVEWWRAEARKDLATVRRGVASPPVARRQQLTREAEAHWRRVIELNTDPDLTDRALRRLYQAVQEDGRFEESLQVLRALAARDSEDETGLSDLWKRGWREFDRGNNTGAIGYWSELRSIYPTTRTARIANYWTGRAYQRLGQKERAHALFRQIAASDVTDFYAEQALARLPAGEIVAPSMPVPIEWPSDRLLLRATRLTDAGLDDLALAEVNALGGAPEVRASEALRAVTLARKGENRPSADAVYKAFPQLGWSDQTAVPATGLALYYPIDFGAAVVAAARRERLDPYLVLAMIRQESAFDRRAESVAGARGLLQLMPATGREVAGKLGLPFTPSRLWEPDVNLRLGTRYFGEVLAMFDGDVHLALAGYNGGPYRMRRLIKEAGAVERDQFLEGLPVTESRRYVKRILLLADSYRRLYPDVETRVQLAGP